MAPIATNAQHTSPPATSDSGRGIVRFVHRHPLGAFFAWFFTVGQVIAFIPVLAFFVLGLLVVIGTRGRLRAGPAQPRQATS